jgi:uncharacterized protein (UPF0210 family)
VRLRALTLGVSLDPTALETTVIESGAFLARAATTFRDRGFDVDTTRLTTQPVDQAIAGPAALVDCARRLEAVASAAGIDYVALGPARLARPGASLAWVEAIADAVLATDRLFASVQIGLVDEGVSVTAARACARAIQRIAQSTEHGFGNLRFAVQACVPPGGPFFPTGYHDGGPPRFSIALEAADLAVDAFGAPTLAACRDRLVLALNEVSRRLLAVVDDLNGDGPRFGGIDLTLAPFPTTDRSIVHALERLGIRFGGPGTLAAVAVLADALRRVDAPRCGFSGVMLPLLEDSLLAERHAEGLVRLETLLLAAAVCGAGLDTVPLPGDATDAQLTGILLDLAALAVILDKPLTARLLPVPHLAAGDRTAFDFPYFANSTVASLAATGPTGAIAAAATLDLRPRLAERRPTN